MRNELVRRLILLCAAVLLAATFVAHVDSAEPKKLVVYAPNTTYSVDVIDRKGTEYVGLVELLEPLGRVEAKLDGKTWALDFASGSRTSHGRFRDGKKDAELPSGKLNLRSNFFTQDSHGYVPLDNLQEVVAQIAGIQTQLHAPTRHLYLGGVGIHYSAEIRKNRLVLSFTSPVAPAISSEGDVLRLTFTRDPLLSSGNDAQDFKDAAIQSTSFAETNSGAELIVRGNTPLVANSSDGGRTLTISPPAAVQTSTPSQPAQSVATPQVQTPPPKPETPLPPPSVLAPAAKPAFLVVIDAAHGGEDTGATLAPKVFEKDVTLSLSRRIAHELQNRGIQVTQLRNSDVAISPDQRAVSTNTSHAAIYVSVHASTIGHGARIFTSLIPPTTVAAGRTFIPWDAAQSQYLDRSSAVSGSIAFECNRKQLAVKALQGSVSPLNNIATAAVALEVAPLDSSVESLSSADYQQNLAVAVANGIAAIRATAGEKKP
jgi:N-acetylmuramoyl-L-alanine amidase